MPEPQDEVDRIVAAWRRERPDLNVAPLQVMSRLSRLARHLDRARSLACGQFDLELWEFDVLSALRRAGSPHQLSPGQLLTQTLVSSGTMTNRVNRLAGRGLVDRLSDPDDRRGVIVRLTPEGVSRIDDAMGALLQHEERMLVSLDASERDLLAATLRRLVTPFDQSGG